MTEKGIILLGLGPGDPGLVTREAWEILEGAGEVYLRTEAHPTVAALPDDLDIHSFDGLYEELHDFEAVYAEIVRQVLELGKRPDGVVYAVPGHPLVAEATGPEIVRRAKEENFQVRIVEGLSFISPTLAALGVDPLPQLSVVDALELVVGHHPSFPPNMPALIAQVYSKRVAGELKITLMAVYPDEHLVKLVHGAGSGEVVVEELPLHAIDQSEQIGLLTSLYLPPLGEWTSFEGFQELIAHLRSPEGCPWDREQTHQTLRTNLLEEAYEALEAIDRDDPAEMREEFGDLLLQIVLQAQIAAEYGEFTMSEVIEGIHTKLVYRHPHVFGELEVGEAGDVVKIWERLKADEREKNGQVDKGLLDGIPLGLPALAVAEKYQRRAARVGFDWPEVEGVLDKLAEEVEELRDAQTDEAKMEEFGDLLFALVNLARWMEIDPEAALGGTNVKFRARFAKIEAAARAQGRRLEEMSLEEMDAIWDEER